jgi:cyclopropane-fatty-acyl-phospholipid synthase
MAPNVVLQRLSKVDTPVQFLQVLTKDYNQHSFAVRLWDGTSWSKMGQPRFTLVLNHPRALRAMLLSPCELTLGEAFAYRDFDVEGDVEAAFDLAEFLSSKKLSTRERLQLDSILTRSSWGTFRCAGKDRYI